jgi:hypothetical protein
MVSAVMVSLGNRLATWVSQSRRAAGDSCDPTSEAELFADLWRRVLAPLVRRHQLRPQMLDGRSWGDPECQATLVSRFVGEEFLHLPEPEFDGGYPDPLLFQKARSWVWRLHAAEDPIGARVYSALGGAFRSLVVAGDPRVALPQDADEPASWLDRGELTAAAAGASAPADAQALDELLCRAGWVAGLANLGERALSRWLEAWLRDLPELWPSGPWPGAPMRTVFDAVLARVRADAPRNEGIDAALELTDPRIAPPPVAAIYKDAGEELFARLLTPDGVIRPEFARAFHSALRRRIGEECRAARRKRCRLLLLWMLEAFHERVADGLAGLSSSLAGPQRLEAAFEVSLAQLRGMLQDWPQEAQLALEFYRPRAMRERFRAVQRAQQAEDRELVRRLVSEQITEGLS